MVKKTFLRRTQHKTESKYVLVSIFHITVFILYLMFQNHRDTILTSLMAISQYMIHEISLKHFREQKLGGCVCSISLLILLIRYFVTMYE